MALFASVGHWVGAMTINNYLKHYEYLREELGF